MKDAVGGGGDSQCLDGAAPPGALCPACLTGARSDSRAAGLATGRASARTGAAAPGGPHADRRRLLAIVAYAAALAATSRSRPPHSAGGLAAAAGVFGFYLAREAPEAVQAGTRIPASELVLDQVEVEPTGRAATLTARVHNGSEAYRLRDLTLALRPRDRPGEDTAASSAR